MRQDDDLEEINRAVRAAEVPLDEVTRMRVQTRILEVADRHARRPRRWPVRLSAWALFAVVPAAAALLIFRARFSGAPTTNLAAPDDGPRFTHLDVPAGAKIHTRLGRRASITLTGPAVADVAASSADLVEIHFPQGVLVGEYDHSLGGTLRIDSPGAVTEIVGTVFAVEASAKGSRISVSHGRVKVRDSQQRVQMIGDGQSWTGLEQGVVGRMPPEAQKLFEMADEISGAAPPEAKAPPTQPEVPPALPGTTARATGSRNQLKIVRQDHSPAPARMFRRPAPVVAPSTTIAAPSSAAPALPAVVPPPAPEAISLPDVTAIAAPAEEPSAPVASTPAPRPEKNQQSETSEASIEGLYASAESAMTRGDRARARMALEKVVKAGSGAVVSAARYDLARLAARDRDFDSAARIVDELLQTDATTPLREPARFLRCRIDADRGHIEASAACMRRFLEDYPHSVHAASARATLSEHGR